MTNPGKIEVFTSLPLKDTAMPSQHPQLHDHLVSSALALGASAATVLPVGVLQVDGKLAALCGSPHRCPSYGLAPGCPPHAPSSTVFQKQLASYQYVLVFKIDALIADLLSPSRLTIARTVHRITAKLEQTCKTCGLHPVKGFAAGSCKELFCSEDPFCRVLHDAEPCPYPDLARPSLSAVGIDFKALANQAGWAFSKIQSASPPDEHTAMGLMAGLVLFT
ncbi:DUF2284 domain-containing protein [Desulfobulbus oligotrophicus]|uniref:DUF2284 domain-containing protein n=1 Tax=Desulfobulbus oligotrophicus TaxID=1909699 RepID=A0A7T5VDV5_9BACT|nr:DUF2284 domain-containing protein [Desulfobulbus oligotrophicus]QQG66120.1 hypothetical protein HP555_09670 [Desulfobulbus oligotrophicus]